ncbi:hypothetical protein GCM10010306_015630 [Streptomyces umbrinus]|nr:hypothetical protein GCM10010306_015630 [Streptomyces umbrinus]
MLTPTARQLPLLEPLLPLELPLLPRPLLHLTLLLPLHLGPDPDQPIGATTHALQALPHNSEALPPNPDPQPTVTRRL